MVKHCHKGKNEWNLVWSDEFENDGMPDPSKWGYEVGFVRNDELQYYTNSRSENIRIEGGELIIEAHKETFNVPGCSDTKDNKCVTAPYTSGSLTTRGKADWRYGRIEVMAKLPTGRGIWPAIWMLGSNIQDVPWPACGEIDIMEYVGFEPDLIHANTHTTKSSGGTNFSTTIKLEEPGSDYHIYAIEWYEDRIDFFLDDIVYHTYYNDGTGTDSWPFNKEHYLILNIAVGGGWGGQQGIDDSIFPQKMHIDYVRVYQ